MYLPYTIAVDFDGTLCTNKYPDIGLPIYKTINYIKREQENGAKIILYTCRTDNELEKAVKWCFRHGLIFDAINENLPEHIQAFDSDCRKICADLYIDDRAINVKDL